MSSIEKGLELFNNEKYTEAIGVFVALIAKFKNNPELYYHRAMAYLKLSEFEKSFNDFETAISLSPDNAHYISQKAVVLLNLGRNAESLKWFDKALLLEPQNPYRYSSRAYAKESLGDTHGAIDDYKKCIELDPSDAVAHNNLGLLEEKLGYYSKKRFEIADQLADNKQVDVESFIKEIKEQESKNKSNAQKRIIEISDKSNFKSSSPTLFSIFWETLFTSKGRKEFWSFVKTKILG